MHPRFRQQSAATDVHVITDILKLLFAIGICENLQIRTNNYF